MILVMLLFNPGENKVHKWSTIWDVYNQLSVTDYVRQCIMYQMMIRLVITYDLLTWWAYIVSYSNVHAMPET